MFSGVFSLSTFVTQTLVVCLQISLNKKKNLPLKPTVHVGGWTASTCDACVPYRIEPIPSPVVEIQTTVAWSLPRPVVPISDWTKKTDLSFLYFMYTLSPNSTQTPPGLGHQLLYVQSKKQWEIHFYHAKNHVICTWNRGIRGLDFRGNFDVFFSIWTAASTGSKTKAALAVFFVISNSWEQEFKTENIFAEIMNIRTEFDNKNRFWKIKEDIKRTSSSRWVKFSALISCPLFQ